MNKSDEAFSNDDRLIAWYRFDNSNWIGEDSSSNKHHAVEMGMVPPYFSEVNGRTAAVFAGGNSASSYFKLPKTLLQGVSDETGLTITTWVCLDKGNSVWERIFDFGTGAGGPYLFLTRNLRGVCYAGTDLACDPGKACSSQEWCHIALTITGTNGGTKSSAGPVLYINGEVAADGSISQTTSGTYAAYRGWLQTLQEENNYQNCFIGKSQYDVDPDFKGALTDFRVYRTELDSKQIAEIMCEALTDQEIIRLAADKYLSLPSKIVHENLFLPSNLMNGMVHVLWSSSHPDLLSEQGKIGIIKKPSTVKLTAVVKKGEQILTKYFELTVLPDGMPAYRIAADSEKKGVKISDTLYGLFFEDINNAADGGIYAEMIKNRSFEAFIYEVYDVRSGENGVSGGRKRTPLDGWFGDLKKAAVKNKNGLNDFFHCTKPDTASYYITVSDHTTLFNRGFTDKNENCSMFIQEGENYYFSIWTKLEGSSDKKAEIRAVLVDDTEEPVSTEIRIYLGSDKMENSRKMVSPLEKPSAWIQYGSQQDLLLNGKKSGMAQLKLTFTCEAEGGISIDMISLMPESVWGAKEEAVSESAHKNYLANSNYRLRRDLVEAMIELHPAFLRFPGGCISEGSYIWENVYDWKDSIGLVELRRENYNVWGYMMTLGLGYLEYFQLAEDIHAVPLPVMACGVLCQARSDYANPAGGLLREQYINNFTDLIDFAIGTDKNNVWACLRRQLGHEEPFNLHYLGVGNENWGTEFFANFEIFKNAIDDHMMKYYPGYSLTIISTVGAQADDEAFQNGWKFLSGRLSGGAKLRFTNGIESSNEEVCWYSAQKNYMDTIVDEHYYRSNEYLYENADRYNYYYRNLVEDGSINENTSSKVFVGEYASSDKNTLAGAVAEAAVMTGFEKNSDVVRLAATAPLFNKVLTDDSYRWTPDAIWFDEETVWRTPNYFVQQMFAGYLGNQTVPTIFEQVKGDSYVVSRPHGGISIAVWNSTFCLKKIEVRSNSDHCILFMQDFTNPLNQKWCVIPGSTGYTQEKDGLVLHAQDSGQNGLYLEEDSWTDYTVELTAARVSGEDGIAVGVGVLSSEQKSKECLEYVIHYSRDTTGVRVFKNGVEGYTLGDFAIGRAAGNMRAACNEELINKKEYTIKVNYGGDNKEQLLCSYYSADFSSEMLSYKLEEYNREIFHSVTKSEKNIYMKLVNPDVSAKLTQLKILGSTVENSAEIITLTGSESLVSVSNVNKKNQELIKPISSKISVEQGCTNVLLPAHSVNVCIFTIAQG